MKILLPMSIMLLKMNMPLAMLLTINVEIIILVMLKSYDSSFMSMLSTMFMTDQLSKMMILLSLMSSFLILLSSNNLKKIAPLIVMILIMLVMVFSFTNMVNFYILFEMVLIPTLILISTSGSQPERLQAAMYLIMYTVTGSLPLLVGILLMQSPDMTFCSSMNSKLQFSMMMMMAFLIKMPMFLFHLWLPKAHVEAPLEGSMILAAILLKLGGYGVMRFMPMVYSSMKSMPTWLVTISMVGASITSMNCMRQKDLKSIIAYSSVAHMGLVLSSMFTMFMTGQVGAILMMIGHGFSSSALFLLVTTIYSNYHTRNIALLKGMLIIFPNLTFWWFMFLAINISAPPTINTISEMFITSSLINWSLYSMYLIFTAAMTTAAFTLILYTNLSHNMSEMKPSKQTSQKTFSSMMLHLYPLISMTMKMEIMFL